MKSSFSFKHAVAIGAIIIAVAFQAGCAAVMASAAVGAGTVAYVRGELKAGLDRPYATVLRAANNAIKDLEFTKDSEKKDALVAVLMARTAEDRKIQIRISRESETLTNVEIRVDTFGDEKLSHTIFEKIKAEL